MDGKLSPSDAPFPVMATLFGLTFVTGLIDAVSVLGLGHVFTANMTGNVVFLGFALGGAPGFSITASFAAVGGFMCGALVGGRLVRPGANARDTGIVFAIEVAALTV